MSLLFHLERVPEPELMDESSEVEAYASATAQSYLAKIDRTFVDHVSRLFPTVPRGKVLDIGCGPGQIPIMMARRWPELHITGVDAAPHMIAQAKKNSEAARVKVSFEVLRLSTNGGLQYEDRTFDLVTCNSVIHHLSDPLASLNEISRITKPQGAVLIRDLRRPSALTVALHVSWFGRHYTGEMRRLYESSVRAAYTVPELEEMLHASKLNDGRSHVFRHSRTHIGIERAHSSDVTE